MGGLREIIPEALESAKGSLARMYWERTQCMLQAYREGAVFGDAPYRRKLSALTNRRMKLSTGI